MNWGFLTGWTLIVAFLVWFWFFLIVPLAWRFWLSLP